jgi:uncharacterized membrane protein SirB2
MSPNIKRSLISLATAMTLTAIYVVYGFAMFDKRDLSAIDRLLATMFWLPSALAQWLAPGNISVTYVTLFLGFSLTFYTLATWIVLGSWMLVRRRKPHSDNSTSGSR